MKLVLFITFFCTAFCCTASFCTAFYSLAVAETTVRVCSQNLARVGKPPFGRKAESTEVQAENLIDRFLAAKCDVIAVQEVYGRNKGEAGKTLESLGKRLSAELQDNVQSFVGESEYDEIRNGFLVLSRVGKVLKQDSADDFSFKKLNPYQRTKKPTRPPFAIVLDVAGTSKTLLLVSIHFKSKVGGYKDFTGTEFETVRIESADQARRFALDVEKEFKTEQTVAVILGDRNSRPKSATDIILSGGLSLEDFRSGGSCKIGSDLEPDCAKTVNRPLAFKPVFDFIRQGGSEKHKGKEELIDDIYLESGYFDGAGGKFKSGLEGNFFEGSDHKLLWVDLPL